MGMLRLLLLCCISRSEQKSHAVANAYVGDGVADLLGVDSGYGTSEFPDRGVRSLDRAEGRATGCITPD